MAIVWQLSIKHNQHGSSIRGVILADSPGLYRRKRGGILNMIRVIRSYFIKPVAREEISIRVADSIFTTITDQRGEFTVSIDAKVETIDSISINQETLGFAFDYPVLFPENEGKYEVISDIDDTIMISYTADTLKRVSTLLFTDPLKRSRIEYTHQLAQYLTEIGSRINYVSKSESNLFGLITAFIRFNGFPQGDIFLTPYLGFREVLSSNKKASFKEDTIGKIIENSTKPFILIGDDSQRDMDVYANIAENFKERIFRVFIRQTKNKMKPQARKFLTRLNATGVDLVVFMNGDVFHGDTDLN
jgi:phosphatidate phosphatase APP1